MNTSTKNTAARRRAAASPRAATAGKFRAGSALTLVMVGFLVAGTLLFFSPGVSSFPRKRPRFGCFLASVFFFTRRRPQTTASARARAMRHDTTRSPRRLPRVACLVYRFVLFSPERAAIALHVAAYLSGGGIVESVGGQEARDATRQRQT